MRISRRDFLRGLAASALTAAVVPGLAENGLHESEEKPAAKLPPLERRGLHVMSAGAAGVPALETLLGEVMPALGLNWLILEVGNGFQYASHPEVADAEGLTREQAGRLAKLARDHGIQLAPQYNCLGHQSWGKDLGALLRAHPEFNETPEMDLEAHRRGFYCLSWCPNHPALNPLLFDLFDELLEAFEAKAFHVGLDEVFIFGQCPRCAGTPNAELFAKAVNDYHSHLVGKRGVEMQMWGDRLINAEATGYGRYEASANDTWPAVDKVPKDIVVCDWHYSLDVPDFPTIHYFIEKGFRVWPAGWNEEASVRRMIEVARKEASPRMLGYLGTTWTDLISLVDGLAGKPVAETERGLPEIIGAVKVGAQLANG